jgi:hypothetical protein
LGSAPAVEFINPGILTLLGTLSRVLIEAGRRPWRKPPNGGSRIARDDWRKSSLKRLNSVENLSFFQEMHNITMLHEDYCV